MRRASGIFTYIHHDSVKWDMTAKVLPNITKKAFKSSNTIHNMIKPVNLEYASNDILRNTTAIAVYA